MNRAERCVVVGAGRIGCGFVAERMLEAGLDVTLVTRTVESAEALNRNGGVWVRLLTRAGIRDQFVGPLEAVPADDRRAVSRRIAESSLVTISVGSSQLPGVAPIIAPGLAEHRGPVNVVVVNNQADAGSRLKELVAAHAPESVERHGYASVLVDRIVTAQKDGPGAPLRFVAEGRIGAAVEARSLRAALPRVAGLRPVGNYSAHVQRKLYVFSAGHAAAAYLGALRGHRLLPRAVDDPEVRAVVLAAMAEGQAGLAGRYGPAFAGGPGRRLAELARFRQAALGDTVDRVGRDPLRKLGVEDRILGPALLAASAGILPVSLAVVAAAALQFGSVNPVLSRRLRRHGVPDVLERYAGVPSSSAFARLVNRAFTLLDETRSISGTRAALATDLDETPLLAS
ncbi:2-dehydropantoate 2-reductase N-terminal domain-containing protein [Pseudonocardia sp.]|uniref:mannitol dehydrogenase family protein n=1 Tax=Pseudonocardia sp. TaxID=60912 RepID=UPI0031FCAE3F